MKLLISAILVSSTVIAFGQGHNALNGAGMQEIAFLQGDWHGEQSFNTGGAALVGKIVNQITEAVGGRYLEEKLATTMPGREPTDVRHYITYDPKAKLYKAWWFNDTAIGPMEFEGNLDGHKLVFETHGEPGTNKFRATYEETSPTSMKYTFELATGKDWRLLFTSSYTK